MATRQTEEKITALYERLSRDDDVAGDSNSILNQKRYLESYAKQRGYTNIVHYTDDRWSGGNFERPGWKRLVADIEAGKVAHLLCKDLSRIGRNYLQTGFYTEIMFRQYGVHFMAVANNIAVVALPLVGHGRSPRGIAASADAAGRCHSPVGAAVIVHAVIASTPAFASVSRGTVCTPALRQLPAKTCHRQLCRKYGYRFSGDTHFLFAKKKQKRREGENEWQSTIWKQK